MAYNTFGRYRYTLKDSARRVRNSRVSLVSSAIPVEKLHPTLVDGNCKSCGEPTDDATDYCNGTYCAKDGEL